MKYVIFLALSCALSGCMAVGWSKNCDTDNVFCAAHYRHG